jgi:hypothetical protein
MAGIVSPAIGSIKEALATNKYATNAVDSTTTTDVVYIGKEDKEGEWLVLKIDSTTDPVILTYATESNNSSYTTYTTAWAARASLTYKNYSTAT